MTDIIVGCCLAVIAICALGVGLCRAAAKPAPECLPDVWDDAACDRLLTAIRQQADDAIWAAAYPDPDAPIDGAVWDEAAHQQHRAEVLEQARQDAALRVLRADIDAFERGGAA